MSGSHELSADTRLRRRLDRAAACRRVALALSVATLLVGCASLGVAGGAAAAVSDGESAAEHAPEAGRAKARSKQPPREPATRDEPSR